MKFKIVPNKYGDYYNIYAKTEWYHFWKPLQLNHQCFDSSLIFSKEAEDFDDVNICLKLIYKSFDLDKYNVDLTFIYEHKFQYKYNRFIHRPTNGKDPKYREYLNHEITLKYKKFKL